MLAAVGLIASGKGTAQTRSVFVEDLTWPEIRDAIAAGKRTALIYTGSTEQNGPHMVTGKHTFIAHYVAGRIAAELGNALVYPILPFAPAGDPARRTGHMRFPGSVSLSPTLYGSVVRAVATSAAAAGFTDIFLMGDHGDGQDVLRSVASELDRAWHQRGVRVHYVSDLYYKSLEQSKAYLTVRGIPPGTHAGPGDTSELWFIDSTGSWIRRDKLAPGSRATESATGVAGDPTRASAELGRVLVGYKISNAVAQIRRLQSSAH